MYMNMLYKNICQMDGQEKYKISVFDKKFVGIYYVNIIYLVIFKVM